MEREWMTGGIAAVDGVMIDGLGDIRRAPTTRVRVAVDGPVVLGVVGDCPATTQEVRDALPAVRAGRWGELSRWAGSYWVVADDGRQRFVCGDLAGIRAVYYSRGEERPQWATEPGLLGRPLVTDLPYLAARLAAGEHHWPHRSPYEEIRMVPGGFGLLLVPGAPPRLIDISGVEPVDDLREGADRFGRALTEAVQHQVRAAGGVVGADLSGGLDSSAAVVLAAEAGDVHAVTYTDGYTSGEDMAFASRVAEHTGIAHTVNMGADEQLPFSFPSGQPTGVEPVLEAAMFAMDTSYLHPVRELPLHLTGHGGDIVLDASGSCWVRLLQDGRRRDAHRQVVAFARLRNTAPGPYWKALKEAAALGRAGSLERAAEALERGLSTPEAAVAGWSWCRLGAGASWLTGFGRHQVAALLRQAARDQQPELADEFDQWAALRAVGASARGWAPYGATLGIRPVYPYLDNQVVRAAFAVPAVARRGLVSYKPLLRAALPELPGWLTARRSKGSFTAQRIAGLARYRAQLEELIVSSPLVDGGLIDSAAVSASLAAAARGQSATVIADLHQLIVTCWWLTGQTTRREVVAC
ncbi:MULTISPECIES: asparagine synthase-related protein [unclassified Streptomyces]|uniref:asparagine synthase-related protein n=1 Tax=unclassified Streptomyces TaxID=2593676 RepID=UPI00168B639F|nr:MULTISPECIES: asparagine synthase-related protein [unclassified Streptomyces]MBD3009938.1 asparagine synthase [Streptomyces sp. 5-10]